MLYAKELDAKIKIVGSSKREDEKVSAFVAPVMIGRENPLYSVNDVFNGIYVKGNVLGDTMFYGKGAGKIPTASAVVADVVDAAKHIGTNIMTNWSTHKLELADFEEVSHRFFVRVDEVEKEAAAKAFGQVEEVNANVAGEYAFITKLMTEKEFKEKAVALSSMRNRIRVAF